MDTIAFAITKTLRGGWFSRRHIRELLKEECSMRGRNVFYVEDWSPFSSRFEITGSPRDVREITERIDEWLACRAA